MVNSNTSAATGARRVTLRDVAVRAGVSVMTVSRALREDTYVKAELRSRLRKLAARLGYRPDPHLSALAAYRKRIRPPAEHAVIAYLTTDVKRAGFQASVVSRDAFVGAAERGRETGYRVEHVWLPELRKRHRDPSAVLIARGIRGLILSRLPSVEVQLDLAWEKFSCVAVGYSLQEPAFHRVASHLFQDLGLAFNEVIARGYRRPALLLSRGLDRRTQHQFHGAFLFGQQSLPPANRLPILWSGETVAATDLGPFIKRHAPDVLLSIWPLASAAVQQLKLRLPRDIGFVDLCLEDRASAISGVYQDFRQIGRTAVDRVNLLLQTGERGPPQKAEVTALYGEWVEGETLRAAAARTRAGALSGKL